MNVSVRSSIVFYWLKTKFSLTESMVVGNSPNTIFGLIPVGRNEVSQPLNRISRVQVSTKVEPGSLVIGALLVLLSLMLFSNGLSAGSILLGLLMLVAAVAAFAMSYRAEFIITDNGGGKQQVLVSPLDKEEIQRFAQAVNERLATQTE